MDKCINCEKKGGNMMVSGAGEKFCNRLCKDEYINWKLEFFATERAKAYLIEQETKKAEEAKKQAEIGSKNVVGAVPGSTEVSQGIAGTIKSFLPGGTK